MTETSLPTLLTRLNDSALMRKRLSSALVIFYAAALSITLVACATVPPPAAMMPPKLVVLLAVDGLPYRQTTDYYTQLGEGGLRRLMDGGAWFENANYGHARTVTAAGHAVMLTGAHPQRTGIVANDWRDANTGEPEYCTGDITATYIGHKTNPLDGTSPKNLKVQTVGDMLKMAQPKAKVIAISGKDRGAILPAGQLGTPYMYMGATGQFASSTYYMKEHPTWVTAFHASKPADMYFGQEWKALLPESAYAQSLPDTQKWFRQATQLPLKMGVEADGPGPRFYGSLLTSPFGDDLTLKFARAAIAGEQLGQRGVTDVLVVSLSGHDYINHSFSAESRLSHDHLLHLDRLFAQFFKDLDSAVGSGNYLLAFTSDHGFMPAPERSAELGLPSGRFSTTAMAANINKGLAQQFGPGTWVSMSDYNLLINKRLLAQTGVDAAAVADAARAMAMQESAIEVAYTRRELSSGSRKGERFFEAMQKTWHPDVSGDVQFVAKPNWTSGSAAANHGSPYGYDTHVPLALYGPTWISPARSQLRVEIVDLAPTLAHFMGIAPPATAQGQILPLARP